MRGIDKVCSYYFLYHFGYALRKNGIMDKFASCSKVLQVCFFVFSLLQLLVLNRTGRIALDLNSYVNPFFLFMASLSGWIFLYVLALLIQKVDRLKHFVSCIGQNTMAVIIFHFLCFKIVSYVGVICENKPTCLVTVFPVLYKNSFWWVAYLAVGLGIPVGLSVLWKEVK